MSKTGKFLLFVSKLVGCETMLGVHIIKKIMGHVMILVNVAMTDMTCDK